jgi:hypothetical protein
MRDIWNDERAVCGGSECNKGPQIVQQLQEEGESFSDGGGGVAKRPPADSKGRRGPSSASVGGGHSSMDSRTQRQPESRSGQAIRVASPSRRPLWSAAHSKLHEQRPHFFSLLWRRRAPKRGSWQRPVERSSGLMRGAVTTPPSSMAVDSNL